MGWSGKHNRKRYIAEVKQGWTTSDGAKVTTRKHHASGNADWLIQDVVKADGSRDAYIEVLLWEGGMVKHMDESMGPYVDGCPVAWLDEVPEPEGTFAHDWRMRLRGTPVNRCENCEQLDCPGHAQELVVLAAYGSWATNVPEGWVGVFACYGGYKNGHYASAGEYRLVAKAEYDARGRLFIVDSARHPVWEYDEANPNKPSQRTAA